MPALQPKGSHYGLILPLCTSSATVGLALMQYPMFNCFLQPTNPSIAGRPLSKYWEPMVTQGVPIVALWPVTSTIAGLLSARWLRSHATLETMDVSKWYTLGAALAAGHFVFVPLVAPLIKKIAEAGREGSGMSEEEIEESNRRDMGRWFMWHTVRTLLVDVPALWCFAEGLALSF